jgi:hypothetical protein
LWSLFSYILTWYTRYMVWRMTIHLYLSLSLSCVMSSPYKSVRLHTLPDRPGVHTTTLSALMAPGKIWRSARTRSPFWDGERAVVTTSSKPISRPGWFIHTHTQPERDISILQRNPQYYQ